MLSIDSYAALLATFREVIMQPHRTIGEALVDVYDSIVTLVRTELRLLTRRLGQVMKAKALGVALLFAAVGPLLLAVIFLILALFYGLIDLGLEAWASALIVALLALIVTGALGFMGIKALTKEVHADESPDEAARENVEAAHKNLDRQEKNLDKQEKQVEKAERNLHSAEEDLHKQQQGGARAPQAHVSQPESFGGRREEQFSGNLTTPGAVRDVKTDDGGIPVSTRPQLDEEERR